MTDSESIRANFPYPIIPREPGLPDFQKINEVHTKGKANCASISATLGGGTHGLLGLGLTPVTYLQLTGHAFRWPQNPGLLPQNVIGTSAQMAEIARRHNEELRVYRQVVATDLALKSQLLDVFEDIYFRGLRDRHTGFTSITYMEMITHLYTNYGIISAVDIIENEKRMDSQYDPSVAIESYFDQIEDAVEFAEAGNSPFTTSQITTKAFIQMFATGLYKDKCKAWNRLVPSFRTWATFKLIFTAAARELREMQSMTGNSGYVNNVTQELLDQTALALNTLASAASEDRQAVVNMATSQDTVASTLTTILGKLTALQNKVNSLENRVGNQQGNGNHRTGNRNTNTRRNNANNESYCHTHGRTRRDDHTSATCEHPADGHIATATLASRDGGSNRYCGDN